MNKCGLILGVAAVTALAGCLDPKYARKNPNHHAPTTVPAYTGDVEPVAPGTGHLVQVGEQPTGPVEITTAFDEPTASPIGVAVDPGVPGFDDIRPVTVPGGTPAATHGDATGPATTTYTVRPGDTLSKISKRYNIKLDSIRRANPGVKGDVIRVGQKLELPGTVDVGDAPAPSATAASAGSSKPFVPYTGETKEYTVQKGDVLGIIARRHGCTVRQLKELNGMKNDTVYLGKKMKVPAGKATAAVASSTPAAQTEPPKTISKKPVEPTPTPDAADDASGEATVAPADAAAPDSGDYIDYEVAEGEDFANISIIFNVSPSDIRQLNNLDENEELRPGMKLRIPKGAAQ